MEVIDLIWAKLMQFENGCSLRNVQQQFNLIASSLFPTFFVLFQALLKCYWSNQQTILSMLNCHWKAKLICDRLTVVAFRYSH